MSIQSGKWMKFRLRLICAVFCLLFAAVMYKSFDLMVVQREMLTGKAKREIDRYMSLGAVRGEIFDANGERLAASLAATILCVDPLYIKEKKQTEEVISRLNETLGLDIIDLTEKLNKKTRYVDLKKELTEQEVSAVKSLKLPGIIFRKEYKRAYPNGSLAAHFLGFIGQDGDGLEGLEKALNDQLKAKQDKVKVKQDNSPKKRTMIDNLDSGLEQTRGASVVLTIDRRIQYITEKALARAVGTYRAKSGMALVMRPKTGAVVAAAVVPTFDPNNYSDVPEKDVWRNRILTDPFEPGSTFKVFVVAAALEEGIIEPTSVIHCENGAFRVANHIVKDTHSYGDLTVSQVIKHSSNIGSLKIGGLLGNDLLYNYLTRFSFGQQTGLAHLPGEAAGTLRQPKNWHQLDAANIAFGQGISVTALQMVMAMGSLANDGVLMKPYIVDRVLDDEGRVIEQYEPQILRQVVSPLTARQIAAMLRMAVQRGGTATRAEVEGYPVAGKTGTAQKVGDGEKTYTAGKYVASFLGFAPYHDPQLCVMVVLDEPKNGYYGGTVATPAFKEIMENALPLLDLPPTEGKGDPVWPLLQRNSVGAPGLVAGGQPTNFIKVPLKKGGGKRGPIVMPGLAEKKTSPSRKTEARLADLSVGLTVNPGVMPNLRGLSMRQVVEVMSEYGLDLDFQGSGHAIGQNPGPGTTVAAGEASSVIFDR